MLVDQSILKSARQTFEGAYLNEVIISIDANQIPDDRSYLE